MSVGVLEEPHALAHPGNTGRSHDQSLLESTADLGEDNHPLAWTVGGWPTPVLGSGSLHSCLYGPVLLSYLCGSVTHANFPG